MPGGRHATPTVESTLTIADIVAARNDFQRSKRLSDSQTRVTSWQWALTPFLGVVAVGTVVGALIPPGNTLPGLKGRLSNAVGWGYFLCWSLLEYPPLYSNYVQKAAGADSLDQIIYYLIGDASYTAFTTILLWSKFCHAPREGCKGRADSIHLNDALFSINSTACTLALLCQFLAFSPRTMGPSLQCWVVIVSVAVIGGGGLVLALQDSSYLTIPAYLYGISFLRVGSCLIEQMPSSTAASLRRENGLKQEVEQTAHWALLAGGILSVVQQLFDAAVTGVWAVVWENLTKLLLALFTIGFGVFELLRQYEILKGWGLTFFVSRDAGSSVRDRSDSADALIEPLVGPSQP